MWHPQSKHIKIQYFFQPSTLTNTHPLRSDTVVIIKNVRQTGGNHLWATQKKLYAKTLSCWISLQKRQKHPPKSAFS